MNNFFLKSLILPVVVLVVVGGAVAAGVILSKQSEESVVETIEAAINSNDNRLGNAEATVELVEYADFQCPACAQYDPMVKQIMAEHSDWINFAYRHFPLKEIHPNAEQAGHAAEAAGLQGKFWEYKELLYTRQTEWATLPDPTSKFMQYAKELGLNEDQFIRDEGSDSVRNKVESQYQTAVSIGMNSTPSFLINGKKIANPKSYDELVGLLQAEGQ